MGDRLHHAINLAAYRAAAALLLLNPYTPLLWMGQEWAASTPFLYFTDHNPELGKLVTEGRRREFAGFSAFSGQEVPDPQAEETFLRSKLRWEERSEQPHVGVLALYRELLALRRTRPALRSYARETFALTALSPHAIALSRRGAGAADTLLVIINLRETLELDLAAQAETIPPQGYDWSLLLDSEDTRYGGSGSTELLRAASGQVQLLLDGPRAVVLGAMAVSTS
jgi:maltooligosyltrehalose trehalohydrolase